MTQYGKAVSQELPANLNTYRNKRVLKSYNHPVQLILSNTLCCCVFLLTAETSGVKLKSHSVVITELTS